MIPKETIKQNAILTNIDPAPKGGQTTGSVYHRYRLNSEELDLTIETGYYRSSIRNGELLYKLLDFAIDELGLISKPTTPPLQYAIEIATEVAEQHPYKVPDDRATYSSYNEGWTDACDIILEKLNDLTHA
jgi:hypothetical protein